MRHFIEIKKCATDKTVHKIDVTGKTDEQVDKIDDGLNINLNHQKYYTVQTQGK